MHQKNYLGKDSFVWWIANVEDIDDPLKIGRVRARIYGHHTPDKSLIPTEDLPWLQVLLPATLPYNSTSSLLPVGLDIDSQVFGFFLDGTNAQHGIILGSFVSQVDAESIIALSQSAADDRESSKDSNDLFDEPTNYAPEYPLNSSKSTRSGHLIEIDDTEGSERILQQHKSGTFTEIQPDGSRVQRITTDDYEIIAGDKNIHIKGAKSELVDGDVTVKISGDINITVEGTANISASKINLSGDGGQLDHLVKLEKLTAKFNAHKHLAVQAGSSTSGPPDKQISSDDGTNIVSAA